MNLDTLVADPDDDRISELRDAVIAALSGNLDAEIHARVAALVDRHPWGTVS